MRGWVALGQYLSEPSTVLDTSHDFDLVHGFDLRSFGLAPKHCARLSQKLCKAGEDGVFPDGYISPYCGRRGTVLHRCPGKYTRQVVRAVTDGGSPQAY